MKKTLCLYYSRTGTTKEAMTRLADILGCSLRSYTDGRKRTGALGYVGCCFASLKKFIDVNIDGEPDLEKYDRVIIGMPIWVEGPCIMGKSLLMKFGKQFNKEVYYVVTQMGTSDYTKKIYALDEYIGRPSNGHISLRTKDNDYLKEIEAFAETLKEED